MSSVMLLDDRSPEHPPGPFPDVATLDRVNQVVKPLDCWRRGGEPSDPYRLGLNRPKVAVNKERRTLTSGQAT